MILPVVSSQMSVVEQILEPQATSRCGLLQARSAIGKSRRGSYAEAKSAVDKLLIVLFLI
jgi:hypothetical protein